MWLNLTKKVSHLNISLPIAAAVTAYGRMSIYGYKDYVIKNGNLFYSDTDSVYSSIPLPDFMISPDLGEMKLEFVAELGVFLAPKVYAVKMSDDRVVIKIKGSKSNVGLNFTDLVNLLSKDATFKLEQEKWYRSLTKETINVRNTFYTLKVTENKRSLIYLDDKFVGTTPFIVENGSILHKHLETYTNGQIVKYNPNLFALVPFIGYDPYISTHSVSNKLNVRSIVFAIRVISSLPNTTQSNSLWFFYPSLEPVQYYWNFYYRHVLREKPLIYS